MYLSKKRNVESKGAREAGGGGTTDSCPPTPDLFKGKKRRNKTGEKRKKAKSLVL